jgi:hypothetical protein
MPQSSSSWISAPGMAAFVSRTLEQVDHLLLPPAADTPLARHRVE